MNLVEHAKNELRLVCEEIVGTGSVVDEMTKAMHADVLQLIEAFASQGHSGSSAGTCISLFERLARFKPLCPLTGEPDEWENVTEMNGGKYLLQNKRRSSVFKDFSGRAWDIDGRVFEEPDGARYTDKDSSVDVTFPYTPRTIVVKVDKAA